MSKLKKLSGGPGRQDMDGSHRQCRIGVDRQDKGLAGAIDPEFIAGVISALAAMEGRNRTIAQHRRKLAPNAGQIFGAVMTRCVSWPQSYSARDSTSSSPFPSSGTTDFPPFDVFFHERTLRIPPNDYLYGVLK
ncbi:hypothetical protein [Mesorhizobium sp. M0643]|uniref:hypothetical protein n=1 Tax=Mesorhizobium sp. M0643 TaxID=2956978 RepID=UPI003336B84B